MVSTAEKLFDSQHDPETKSLVVSFSGNQRGLTGRDFSQKIKQELMVAIHEAEDLNTVIFDLKDLTALSSEGLGLLIRPRTRIYKQYGHDTNIIISNPNTQVKKLLSITHLDTIFTIQEGRAEDILAALQSDPK